MPSQDSFASKGEAQKSGFSHHKETPLSCTAPKLWALSLFSSSQHKLPTPTLRSWPLPIVVVSVAYVDSGYNPHAPRLVCLPPSPGPLNRRPDPANRGPGSGEGRGAGRTHSIWAENTSMGPVGPGLPLDSDRLGSTLLYSDRLGLTRIDSD